VIEGGENMYTRNPRIQRDNRTQRYNPPPGYAGNTFSVKHHTPEDIIGDNIPRRLNENEVLYSQTTDGEEIGIRGESSPPDESELRCTGEEGNDPIDQDEMRISERHEKSPLTELLESLRLKAGSEALIILLVMLLIASDGLCAEVLILALCLIAG
jgi:hypothetical protein